MSHPRIFSIKEANEAIPDIDPVVESLMEKRRLMQTRHDELLVLDLIGGEKIRDTRSLEGKEYLKKSAELENLILSFEEEILRINGIGCFLKDLERGLVDFYHVREKQLIFLCWRKGEKKVGFWHAIDDSREVRNQL